MSVDERRDSYVVRKLTRIRRRRRASIAIFLLSLGGAAILGDYCPASELALLVVLPIVGIFGLLFWQLNRCPRCGEYVYSPRQGGYSNPYSGRCKTCGLSLNPRIAAQQLQQERKDDRLNNVS